MKNFWDERYSQEEYVYGILPNEFFKDSIEKLNPGRILLLGEGEGRNAVYAAQLGWKVDAFDMSYAAKEKAMKLAASKNLDINYQVKSIEEINIETAGYDAVGIIFLHLHGKQRELLHSIAFNALKIGGTLILEVFSKDQLKKTSGGPKELELLYSVTEIEEGFKDLKLKHLCKAEVFLSEGIYHSGEASVIRLIATKN